MKLASSAIALVAFAAVTTAAAATSPFEIQGHALISTNACCGPVQRLNDHLSSAGLASPFRCEGGCGGWKDNVRQYIDGPRDCDECEALAAKINGVVGQATGQALGMHCMCLGFRATSNGYHFNPVSGPASVLNAFLAGPAPRAATSTIVTATSITVSATSTTTATQTTATTATATSTTVTATSTTATTTSTTTTQPVDKRELHRVKDELLGAEADRFGEVAVETNTLINMVSDADQRAAKEIGELETSVKAAADSTVHQLDAELQSLQQQLSAEITDTKRQISAQHDVIEASVTAVLADSIAQLQTAIFREIDEPAATLLKKHADADSAAATAADSASGGSRSGTTGMSAGGVAAVACICLVGAALAVVVVMKRAEQHDAVELPRGFLGSRRSSGHGGVASDPRRRLSAPTVVVVPSDSYRTCYENGYSVGGITPVLSSASVACTENGEAMYTLATAAGPSAVDQSSSNNV